MTIGRKDCDWTLADPLLSRKHCTVEFLGGVWQLRDQSANGTVVNNLEVIGPGIPHVLQDGDRLFLGDYEIEVRIKELSSIVAPCLSPSNTDERDQLGFADSSTGVFGVDPPRGNNFAGVRLPGLDNPPQRAFVLGPQRGGTPSDHAPVGGDYVPPPVVVSKHTIPDNWFDEPGMDATPTPRKPAPFGAVQAPVAPPPPIPTTERWPPVAARTYAAQAEVSPAIPLAVTAVAATPASSGVGTADMNSAVAAFLKGSQLPPELVLRAVAQPEETLHSVGVLLRVAVAGMRTLLRARSEVKRGFRINQTIVQPRDNNPLKFATSDEHALATLLDPNFAALRALEESFADLQSHQLATAAAVQAAARALLQELDPDHLLAEDASGGWLPGAREKRLWDRYTRRHAQLIEQFEDDLKSAFATAFAKAYEDTVGRTKH